ncbi:hypothetical protein C8R47DRAFT_14745 [Mycena vitilis]|nr:hypothetical protein C8R47DRAFT_14745 [Mycena vitilis]
MPANHPLDALVPDSERVLAPILPSIEPYTAFKRISLRPDWISEFLKALCAQYSPPAARSTVDPQLPPTVDLSPVPPAGNSSPPETRSLLSVSGFLRALCRRFLSPPSQPPVEEVNRPLPVYWSREEEPSPPKQPKTEETSAALRRPKLEPVAPLLPKEESVEAPIPDEEPFGLSERVRAWMLERTIYQPHGKWAWTAGLFSRESEPSVLLSSGAMCSAFLKTAMIGDRPVKYVSKMWHTQQKWSGFFSELALYKGQLKPLQGRVVPAIINVYSCPSAVDVAMEPPHHSFWIEASEDMPHVLKKRCVEAFAKVHAAGVLHGDVELRHMLIGGDARVTIIDFQESRALEPNAAVQLVAATPDELRLEMRKVKFKLDYEDARKREDEKIARAARLKRKNARRGGMREDPIPEDVQDPPIASREWNLEWVGEQVIPTRYVMPGQSVADVEGAVEEFLDVIDKLEEEETRRDATTTHRGRSPDFEPPLVATAKRLRTKPLGKKLGARTVTPCVMTPRKQKVAPDFKPPAAIPARPSVNQPVPHPTTRASTLKRKSEDDRPQEDHKRIRVNTRLQSDLPRSPPLHEAPPLPVSRPPPAVKVRDFVHEAPVPRLATSPRLPELRPTRAPLDSPRKPEHSPTRASAVIPDAPLRSSPMKRKRGVDDEPLETRGQPRMRISCNTETKDSSRGAVSVSVDWLPVEMVSAPKCPAAIGSPDTLAQNGYPFPPHREPRLVRWAGNM